MDKTKIFLFAKWATVIWISLLVLIISSSILIEAYPTHDKIPYSDSDGNITYIEVPHMMSSSENSLLMRINQFSEIATPFALTTMVASTTAWLIVLVQSFKKSPSKKVFLGTAFHIFALITFLFYLL